MRKLDRYILGHHVAAFGFFALIFTGVIWLTQAVRLIDTVVASGQGARTFLEFSGLVLPQVFVIVLPLSAIGASLYALNRLYSDSELVVMMSSGLGPTALLRPVLMFSSLIAVLMALVLMVAVPIASTALADRTNAIRSDLAASLIVERQFIHPLEGLTLFIADTSQTGEMAGIFLDDRRDEDQAVTYTAERALFLREEDEARLVMVDGVALTAGSGGGLNSVRFDQFVFDLSELLQKDNDRTPRPAEYPVPQLLNPTAEMLDTRYDPGDYISEGHYKLSLPLLTMIYPVIALMTFLAGGYRRSGFGRRVVVAVVVCVLIQVVLFAAEARVVEKPARWPLMYLPQALGLIYVAALMLWLEKGSGSRRRVAA